MEGPPTGNEIQRPRRRRSRLPIVLGAVVVLLALVVVGVGFGAQRFANTKKDEAARQLSTQLGRPVSIGPVRLSLLSGQVEVRDVVIGRDPSFPEEPDPAFRLDRAAVNVSLGSAIFSLGKRVVVDAIAVERPLIQVSRDKQGRLNWQRIAERMDQGPKEPSRPLDAATRDRITGLRVHQLRLDDARVRFVDLARPGAAAEISDVDFAADDVSLGKPFQAQLTAAVLASKKNFDLRASLGAAPAGSGGDLPPPPLEKLTVKLEPVPLAPVAPFAASVMGAGLEELAEGKMSMDLNAAPGAAAPGGRGPTSVTGYVALEGIQFAGGERFDARLNTDVGGDFDKGAVEIRDLSAKMHPSRADASGDPALGEMGIKAQGKIADLLGSPRAESFSVQSVGLDFTRLHGYYPPLDRTAGAELRGPFAITAKGEGSAEQQRLTAMVDLTPTSIVVPGQLKKAPGTALAIELRAEASPQVVKVEKLTLTFAKLVLKAAGALHMQGQGAGARRSFEATVDAPVFAVKEIGALVAPKQVADLPDIRVGLNATASGTVGRPETLKAEVSNLKLLAGKSDLTGRLSLQNLSKPRVAFDGQSKYLDVDDFVPAKKPGAAEAKTSAKAPAKTGKGGGKAAEEPLPPMVRDMEGTVKLAVDRGRAADIDYSNLKTDVTLKQGRLYARTLEVGALGGRFSGAGSEMPLLGDKDSFIARGDVQGLDVAAVIEHIGGEKAGGVLTGRLSGKIDVAGGGTEPKTIVQTLTGLLTGRLAEAQFLPSSLLAPVVEALEAAARSTPFAQRLQGITDKASALLRDRRIGDLGGALKFADGAMEITNPLKTQSPAGPLSLTGKVGLDGEAALNAELALTAEIATALTGGRAKFDGPIPVALRIEGPIRKPRIRPAQPAALAKVLVAALVKSQVGEAARARVEAATTQANDRAKEEAARAAGAATDTKKAAEDRAREEAQKAREAAGRRLRGILGR
jgi:uncharacterized protein involved in outer membrane biogenesis